ncbi:MAG TPA: peptidylprolyl isomerase, partial [Candidatus Enterocola sp.]|nr:peptidylprolyl isomerase [Candidatus Enterocola sp.]
MMNINGKDISKQEFEYFYHKNNSNTSSNYISLDEYVDLFINFKLKVADAYEQKLDTAKSFKDEFNSYRNQLIRPYLTDDSIKEVLVKEAYSRLKEDIEVNHILFRIENQNDTIAAYEKAMSAKKRINKTKKHPTSVFCF